MQKNIIIGLLAVLSLISLISLKESYDRMMILLEECKAASNVINQVYNDNEDYFLDVLVETDVWQKYQSIIPFDYYE